MSRKQRFWRGHRDLTHAHQKDGDNKHKSPTRKAHDKTPYIFNRLSMAYSHEVMRHRHTRMIYLMIHQPIYLSIYLAI